MNSPIKWRGGKRNLRKTIIDMIPDHHCYVEPFAGGLWVFFGKPRSKVEVINDTDKSVMTFYSVLKNRYDDFSRMFESYLISRGEFEYLKSLDGDTLDDVMLAYQFYYINKNSFGGDMSSFNSYYRDSPYLNANAISLLKKAHDRLQSAWIECLPYDKVVGRFDRKDTFFYFDPPYHGTNNGSYQDKSLNFEAMRNMCQNMQGKFLMTINDDEYIRDLFSGFYVTEVEVQYSMSKSDAGRGKFGELIITNY